ncbi:MAG: alpha/beta fold hydrolase [Acidimicrobiales bacterium]
MRRSLAAMAVVVGLVAAGCTVDPGIDLAEQANPPADATPTPSAEDPIPTPTPTPDASGGTPEPADRTRPVPGEAASAELLTDLGEFDRVDCASFDLADLATGPPPSCGLFTVPETWEDPDADATVTIPVVVFDATGTALDDPVVYLEGGPGGHAVETIAFSYDVLVAPYRDTRDVIIYDQRGAGLSNPSLQCDEALELARDLLDEDVDEDELTERDTAAETACRDRLLDDGVDLTSYHSVASAHDLEAMRLALGYGPWNVLGISYGTRLGQTYVRMYPDAARALVLDSILPVAADTASVFTPNAARAFEALFDACEALADCARTYADLRNRFFALVDALDADPVGAPATDNLTGQTYPLVVVDGESLLQITFGALYSPVLFAAIPQLVAELEEGTTDLLSSFLSIEVTNLGFTSVGMLISVECHEEISFGDPADIETALTGDPYYDRFADSANARPFYETCERWPAGSAPAVENEPVTSDVPTLLMGGALDPITPPSAIDDVAEGFSRSFGVRFRWEGHGPGADECGSSIIREFFDAPTSAPSAQCADAEPPVFVRRPVGELTLEPVVVSGAGLATLETLAPVEWDNQGLGVWARSDSLADPSLLAQFAFPFAIDREATLELTLSSFGVDGEPRPRTPLTTPDGQTYDRWRVEAPGATWDIAIGDDTVIAVAAYPDEIDEVVSTLAPVYDAASTS